MWKTGRVNRPRSFSTVHATDVMRPPDTLHDLGREVMFPVFYWLLTVCVKTLTVFRQGADRVRSQKNCVGCAGCSGSFHAGGEQKIQLIAHVRQGRSSVIIRLCTYTLSPSFFLSLSPPHPTVSHIYIYVHCVASFVCLPEFTFIAQRVVVLSPSPTGLDYVHRLHRYVFISLEVRKIDSRGARGLFPCQQTSDLTNIYMLYSYFELSLLRGHKLWRTTPCAQHMVESGV